VGEILGEARVRKRKTGKKEGKPEGENEREKTGDRFIGKEGYNWILIRCDLIGGGFFSGVQKR